MKDFNAEVEGDASGRCGGCNSRNVVLVRRAELGVGVCLDCRRVQELETRNWPEMQMCDNCAFRAGSPERADPYRWAEVAETIARNQPFHCHKGLALDLTTKQFSAPDPATGRVHVCAGWLAANIAHFRRQEGAA